MLFYIYIYTHSFKESWPEDYKVRPSVWDIFIKMNNGKLALCSCKKYKVKGHGSVKRNAKYESFYYTLEKAMLQKKCIGL
jgi:hypothetical protein